MRPMWVVALLFWLCPIGACGFGRAVGLADDPEPCSQYEVRLEVLDGQAGNVTWDDCSIRVHPEPGFTLYATRVVAHELWHAAGFEDHLEGWSAPFVVAGDHLYPSPPAPGEISRMQGVPGPIVLQVLSPDLAEPTQTAAGAWNDAVGREIFVVIDGS